MKNRKNGGYTLIETMIAIVILAIIVVPTGSSIVLSYKINAKTEQLLDAQLKLTSAVEYLKFHGYENNKNYVDVLGVECKKELSEDAIVITCGDVAMKVSASDFTLYSETGNAGQEEGDGTE